MTRIQLRHDTAANFASVNPVLLAGEAAVETDTNKIKIGDGTTAYNSLEYFGGELPDLSNYITTDAPQIPLEYVEELNNIAVDSNDSVYWSRHPEIGNDFVITYYEANNTGIVAKTTASGNGILNPEYMITYNGDLTNKTIKYTARNDENRFADYKGCYIGNTSATGVFTPYFCISSDYNNNNYLMEVLSPTLGPDQYGWTDGSRWVSNPYGYHSSSFYRTGYSPLAWSFEISVIDDNGTLKFNIKTRLKDGTLGNNVDYTPTHNTDISVLNTVVFPMKMSQSSSADNKNYDISKNGIFDLEGNQLWKVSGTTKKLNLNIGTGLAVQNGNLVNTNPTPPTTVDITEAGAVLSPMSLPGDTPTTLTLLASGSEYVAPTDGWFYLAIYDSTAHAWLAMDLYIGSTHLLGQGANGQSFWITGCVPARRGQKVVVAYSGYQYYTFRFIPTYGIESEGN